MRFITLSRTAASTLALPSSELAAFHASHRAAGWLLARRRATIPAAWSSFDRVAPALINSSLGNRPLAHGREADFNDLELIIAPAARSAVDVDVGPLN